MRSATLLFALLASLASQLVIAPAFADFQDRGMIDGAVRTDLAPGRGTANDLLTLWYFNPVPDGCAFSVLDPLNGIFGCPGLSWVRNKPGGEPGWAGLQAHPTCGASNTALGPADTRVGDSWLGCLTYPGSPYFALNNPASQYWVVVANSEPSFDQCNDGPPVTFRSASRSPDRQCEQSSVPMRPARLQARTALCFSLSVAGRARGPRAGWPGDHHEPRPTARQPPPGALDRVDPGLPAIRLRPGEGNRAVFRQGCARRLLPDNSQSRRRDEGQEHELPSSRRHDVQRGRYCSIPARDLNRRENHPVV